MNETILTIGIYIGGALSLVMVVFHIGFPRIFNWGEDFTKLGLLNRRIVFTIHIALLLLFLYFATLSLTYPKWLARAEGPAGLVTLGYALFWLWRTIWQLIYFKQPRQRRIRRSSMLHYLLILVFAILFVVYFTPFGYRLYLLVS